MTLHGRILGGRYELGPLLGAGGMASVYWAHDRVLERTVAVKVLGPPFDRDSDSVGRFGREARAAAALSHPNVVAVFDTGSEQGVHFIVMEYVDGESLAATIRQHGVVAPKKAAEIVRGACGALAAAHQAGLVHRDVKPGNVLVSWAGLVKVTDFGIAAAVAAPALTAGGSLLGTAAYVSPEQAQGQPLDARSDVYSLGCVLYELLTGTPPFVGNPPLAVVSRQVTELPEPPSRRNPGVPAALERVVMTALAKSPARRYQTAASMAEDLECVEQRLAPDSVPEWRAAVGPPTDRLAGPAIPSQHPTVAMPAARPVRRPARGRWLLAVSVVVVLAVAALLWPRGGGAPAVGGNAGGVAAPAPTHTTSPGPSAPSTRPPSLPAALAALTGVVMAGERQGTVDHAAEDVLHRAEDVVHAVQDGRGEDARNKLADLERKVDELISKGKIWPPTAIQVRRAVARLGRAVAASG